MVYCEQWRRQNFAAGGGARARDARVPKFVVSKSSRSESHLADISLTPSRPAVPNCCYSKGPAPCWCNPPFLIFDIRALWRSVAPECQKIKSGGLDQYGKV